MIIDAGGYLGNFPYRKLYTNTPGSLSSYASSLGITHMVVSSVDAVFYRDASSGNDMLIDMLSEKTEVIFIPFCVVNPAYPGWEDDARKAVLTQGFKGFELSPHYHRYKLNDENGLRAIGLAEKLNVPVRITSGFEDLRQRSYMDVFEEPSSEELIDAARRFPSVKFLLIGHSSQNLAWCIDNNAYLDFSRLDVFEGVINTMKGLLFSPQKIIFATLAPFKYIEPQFVKLRHLDLDEGRRSEILYKNLNFLI